MLAYQANCNLQRTNNTDKVQSGTSSHCSYHALDLLIRHCPQKKNVDVNVDHQYDDVNLKVSSSLMR